jgi:hypothetical protein
MATEENREHRSEWPYRNPLGKHLRQATDPRPVSPGAGPPRRAASPDAADDLALTIFDRAKRPYRPGRRGTCPHFVRIRSSQCRLRALSRGLSGIIEVSERSMAMDKVAFRLVHLHDQSCAAEIRMANGTLKTASGFMTEGDAEAWLLEQRSMAPAKEAWVRLPTLNWDTNSPRLNIFTHRLPGRQ